MGSGAFEQFFGDCEAPRQSAKEAHLFSDILFLVVCASIAGARGWEDIEDFGDLHLSQRLSLMGKVLQKNLKSCQNKTSSVMYLSLLISNRTDILKSHFSA